MGIHNQDEIKGKPKQGVGRVKDKAGEWTGDPEREPEGEALRDEGRQQETYGKARRKTGHREKEFGERVGR